MVQAGSARRQGFEQAELIPPALVDDHSAVVVEIIAGFSADNGLPREALRRAVENWELVLPVFLDMLEAYVDDPEANEADADPLFFIVHLFGQMRETRAYRPLMRLAAMDSDRIERVLGDATTATFPRVLASVFDGDPEPMREVILNHRVDEFVRSGLLETLALLTRDGPVAREWTETFLLQCYTELMPRDSNCAWVGWQSAISFLALRKYTDLVRRAFEDERIYSGIMSFRDFEEDMAAVVADPAGKGFGHREIGYFGDVIAELSHWHAFSEAASRPRPQPVDHAAAGHKATVARSVKTHGRPRGNDPCPCGSGKKYKKCCRDT